MLGQGVDALKRGRAGTPLWTMISHEWFKAVGNYAESAVHMCPKNL